MQQLFSLIIKQILGIFGLFFYHFGGSLIHCLIGVSPPEGAQKLSKHIV